MKTFSYIILLLTITLNSLYANSYFIENKGQWNNDVKYLFQSHNYYAWITDFGIVFDYFEDDNDNYAGNVIKMKFINNNLNVNYINLNQSNTYYNYFIGNDKTKWATNIRKYQEVIVKNIYDGIDIRYYADSVTKNLRYDFEVAPFANPNDIKFAIEGAKYANNNTDELEIIINDKYYKHTHLFAYQNDNNKVNKVECSFKINTEMLKQVRNDNAYSTYYDEFTSASLLTRGLAPVIDFTWDDNSFAQNNNKNNHPVSAIALPPLHRGELFPSCGGVGVVNTRNNKDFARNNNKNNHPVSAIALPPLHRGELFPSCGGVGVVNARNNIDFASNYNGNNTGMSCKTRYVGSFARLII
ncbi:MAG: hypothetical protein FWG85_05180, partial [Bacteroidetes bacterium]|nr:hypothetical protein [Bacteroidota bacterium]